MGQDKGVDSLKFRCLKCLCVFEIWSFVADIPTNAFEGYVLERVMCPLCGSKEVKRIEDSDDS